MLNKTLKVEHVLALSLAATTFLWVGTGARAQSAQDQDNRTQDNRVQVDDNSRMQTWGNSTNSWTATRKLRSNFAKTLRSPTANNS